MSQLLTKVFVKQTLALPGSAKQLYGGGQANTYTDITPYRLNWPRGQFSENQPALNLM